LSIFGAPASGIPSIVDADIGSFMSCGLDGSSDVWCWGVYGVLGDGVVGPQRLSGPSRVTLPVGFRPTQIRVGDTHACAMNAEGRVACWGLWSANALVPAQIQLAVATLISTDLRFDWIGSGGFGDCGYSRGRGIFCWTGLGAPEHVEGTR
jgi:hypothetical protein